MKKYKLKETKKNVTEFDAGLNLYAYKEENQNYLFFNNKIYPLRYTPMIFKKIRYYILSIVMDIVKN